MPAAVLAAIAAAQQVLFGENNIAFLGLIKITGKQIFFRHGTKLLVKPDSPGSDKS